MATIKQLQDSTGDIYPVLGNGTVTAQSIDIRSVLDIFYPVGSYYETDNADFDPNTAWGGTWAQDSPDMFVIGGSDRHKVGKTGGSETHSHKYGMRYYEYYGDISYQLYLKDYATNTYKSGSGSNVTGNVNNNTSTSAKSVSRPQLDVEVNTSSESSMPPFIAVYRWHRVA